MEVIVGGGDISLVVRLEGASPGEVMLAKNTFQKKTAS
jgi:hypothetical protein